MRAAYDDEYVYFLVQWDEVAGNGFSVGANAERDTWEFDGSDWDRSNAMEDRVSLMFFIRGEFFDDEIWEQRGCAMACHADNQVGMYTVSDTTDLDCWVWGSVTTDPMGHAFDAAVVQADFSAGIYSRVVQDLGASLYFDNNSGDTLPEFMHKADPNFNADYPLTLYKIQGFDVNSAWEPGSTIPGIVNSYPTFSASDVLSAGQFDNGTWTVEFKRARATKNGDDVQF